MFVLRTYKRAEKTRNVLINSIAQTNKNGNSGDTIFANCSKAYCGEQLHNDVPFWNESLEVSLCLIESRSFSSSSVRSTGAASEFSDSTRLLGFAAVRRRFLRVSSTHWSQSPVSGAFRCCSGAGMNCSATNELLFRSKHFIDGSRCLFKRHRLSSFFRLHDVSSFSSNARYTNRPKSEIA